MSTVTDLIPEQETQAAQQILDQLGHCPVCNLLPEAAIECGQLVIECSDPSCASVVIDRDHIMAIARWNMVGNAVKENREIPPRFLGEAKEEIQRPVSIGRKYPVYIPRNQGS